MNMNWFRDIGVLSPLCRYGIAVFSTVVTLWIRFLLDPWLHDECPFSLFYLSVLLTACLAGSGPAFFAIGLGTFSAAYFFIAPQLSLAVDSLSEIIQLANFVVVNCIATILFSRLKRQRLLAEQRSADNERLSRSLQLADERKDEFLALLAHELRNPLAPIRTGLVMLNREARLPVAVQRVKQIIERQTNNLVRITDDLLDVSRFSRGKVELQIERMDLRDAINEAIEMTQSLMDEKGHLFQKLVSARPLWIDGDKLRLAQLFANLLGNAAKYTPAGGRIVLESDEEDQTVMIMVRDNGIGFAPEIAGQLTLPFTQMDNSRTRDYGGLGLGLTIVDRLARLHGGALQASSRGAGMGSCFSISLPLANEGRDAEDREMTPASHDGFATESASGLTSTGTKQILLVEDSDDARELLAELLAGDGYDVVTANDGITALQRISRQTPDVCILDIGLPGLDGFELARRIRRIETAKQIRLIAVTGWGSEADRCRSRKAGFDVHLAKPVVYSELLACLEPDLAVSDTVVCRK